jgi:hypothetical protein
MEETGDIVARLMAENDQLRAKMRTLQDESPYYPCLCGRRIYVPSLAWLAARAAAPISWPDRFRAAAEVAATGGAHQLRRIATWLEQQPPGRVAAIGRALLDEES